jgi:hypothetical protein
MARYFAQVEDNVVTRVVVCDNPTWLTERLGGDWQETADPYSETPSEVVYCGPGHGFDPEFPERFAPQWVAPVPVVDPEPGDPAWTWYDVGTRAFHNGRIWRSSVAENVWEPGTAGWLDAPPGGIPTWRLPTGSADAWPALDPDTSAPMIVSHNGSFWKNTHGDGNVWEPGSVGIGDTIWLEVDANGDPIVPEAGVWAAGVAYVIDDQVTYLTVAYSCLQAHTSQVGWEPPNVPALWTAV